MSDTDLLVHDLAELDPDLLKDVVTAAQAQRRRERGRQISVAVRRVRDELLSGHSDRRVALIIDAIAQGYQVVGLTPALRTAARLMLLADLKNLSDMPGFETIRKMFQ